jgi:hypothetical protein
MNEPYRFRRIPPVTKLLSAVCWDRIAARAERALAVSGACVVVGLCFQVIQ